MFGHQLEGGDLVLAIKGNHSEIGVLKPVKGKIHYYTITNRSWKNPVKAISEGKKPYIDYINPSSRRIVKLDPSQLDEERREKYDILYKHVKGL